jgi:hypothetical protein
MLFHAAIVCLIVLSISILIAHAVDALRTERARRRRQIEAERLGGLQVDHQVVLHWRLHRQIGQLLALEDPINIIKGLPAVRGGFVSGQLHGTRKRFRSAWCDVAPL